MEERSVVIKMKDEEYLIVPKNQLTEHSPKFRRIFDELKHDEHTIEDFSSEAVKTFINLLEKKFLDSFDKSLFRELYKLAVVFEVKWLKIKFRGWLREEMVCFHLTNEKRTSTNDMIFLFEECWFMMDKWADESMMDQLISLLAHEDNTQFLLDCFSDITKLKTGQIDALLKFGGGNFEIFLKIILQNVSGQKSLEPNLKYLLQNFNLAFCSENHEELYLEVIDTLSNLSEISVADLRYVQQLTTYTARLVRTRRQERFERKSLVFSLDDRFECLMLNSFTSNHALAAVTSNNLPSMFEVTQFLLMCIYSGDPGIEEFESIIASLENICSERKMQKVSKKFLNDMIDALYCSNVHQLNDALVLLNKIKNSNMLCTNYENLVAQCLGKNEDYFYFIFEHPLPNSCTQTDSRCGLILKFNKETQTLFEVCVDKEKYVSSGIHLHDFLSAHNMCLYNAFKGKLDSYDSITVKGSSGWWKQYFPHVKNWEVGDVYIEYNFGDYLCKI